MKRFPKKAPKRRIKWIKVPGFSTLYIKKGDLRKLDDKYPKTSKDYIQK